MAKKRTKKSPEEEAYQELLKKAIALEKSRQTKEENQRALQVGKELAMLLAFLRQVGIGDAKKDEVPKMWLAQVLKDYPKELKKALAYYDSLLPFDIVQNFKGFQISGDIEEKGRLWVAIDWFFMEVPNQGKEGASADAGESSGEAQK